jgi:hypothetical protein
MGLLEMTKTLCPYCAECIREPSRDHIFPDFLGGRRTIAACKGCNETAGNTFEARAALMLYGMQVSMSTWGLSFKRTAPPWKRAHNYKGLDFDISAQDSEPRLTLSRPIREINEDGKLTAITFGNRQEAERMAKRARRKGKKGAVVQKLTVEIDRPLVPFRFELSPAVLRTALKMCYALSTRLPGFTLSDVAHARSILQADPRFLPVNVVPAFETYAALDDLRSPLSHVIYVERNGVRVSGVVQFYGVIQLFCGLGTSVSSEDTSAGLGVLDPLTGTERFSELESLALNLPRPITEEELPGVGKSWLKKFETSAKARGATKPINLTGTLTTTSVP